MAAPLAYGREPRPYSRDVVVADVEAEGDFQFDRQKIGTSPADLRALADWLVRPWLVRAA